MRQRLSVAERDLAGKIQLPDKLEQTIAQLASASVHDSQVFDELLDPENTTANAWADSAYHSAELEASLKQSG